MYTTIKRQALLLVDPTEGGTFWDRLINSLIITLIILNTFAVILETVDWLYIKYKNWFIFFEVFSVTIFTIEYIIRVWTCTCIPKYSHPIKGRIKYILSPGALIDLIAILPFYLPLVYKFDLRFVRSLRLIRFIRFFKLSRYVHASRLIKEVFKLKKEELILSILLTIILIIVASSAMYFVEHDAQPDKFSSIPETMWWSVATLTTVGYGDIYPITVLGKTLTSVISILGIGMFALPAGILASGFSDQLKKKNNHCCPNCGHEL
ncbi:MAG: ion transporter [Flavisolibacter sp.]